MSDPTTRTALAVAQDLAAWQYWDAVPEYVALMQSGVRQQYPSRLAVVAYLRRSPGGGGIDVPPQDLGALDRSAAPAIAVVPQ